MNGFMKEMFQPILLGDGIGLIRSFSEISHAPCAVPVALTRRPHPFLSAFLPIRIRRLSKEELPFLCDLLASVAETEEDRILWLVPCTEEFRRFVEDNRRFLEQYFVCADSGDLVGTTCRVLAKRGLE